jgi:hypothetical protein
MRLPFYNFSGATMRKLVLAVLVLGLAVVSIGCRASAEVGDAATPISLPR